MSLIKKVFSILVIMGQPVVTSYAAYDLIEIDAGLFIEQVISGKDFSGWEIILSGIALSQTSNEETLLNVATLETYQSGSYDNFISISDTTAIITEGSEVRIHIIVERSSASKLGGLDFVIIESAYKACFSCNGDLGDLQYSSVPGNLDQSILLFRMQLAEVVEMMPELGRSLVHAEGVDLVSH